ncbi:MAG: GDSL-type esterase/lipase family protein [Candidatus Dormiibacterota bacterium]
MNPTFLPPKVFTAFMTLAGVALMILSSSATVRTLPGDPGLMAKIAKVLPAVSGDQYRPWVRFSSPHHSVAAEPDTATLDIPGPGGAFSVPYIQTGSDLQYSLETNGPGDRTIVDVTLDAGGPNRQVQRLKGSNLGGSFHNVGYGEHTLDARMYVPEEEIFAAFALAQKPLATARLGHIGRGDVIVAIGDSITEGLSGGPYPPGAIDRLGYFTDWIAARNALQGVDPGLVSGDGRQFPQAGASLHPASRPSFVVQLSQMLEAGRGHPVLIVNEGWSGITSDGYDHVSDSQHFKDLVAAAHPNGWLINLGANDVKVKRPADEYQARMATLVGNLNRLGAPGSAIHLACPSYRNDADQQKKELEATYLPVVDGLRSQFGLAAAPDFFAHYRDRSGDLADGVHPNAAGYAAMAQLWDDALVAGHGSTCAPPPTA